jgi:hypothetical protein
MTDVPAFDAHIVNLAGKPSPDATVTLLPQRIVGVPAATVRSDLKGDVHFSGVSHWIAWPIFADVFPEHVIARVTVGSELPTDRIFEYSTNVRWFGLGNITTLHAGEIRPPEKTAFR